MDWSAIQKVRPLPFLAVSLRLIAITTSGLIPT